MKATLHSAVRAPLAALALALPLAGALVAQPAAAATHAVVAHAAVHTVAFDARALRHDDQAPRVSQLTPSKGARLGERGRTTIHARFTDAASGIDARSVRLTVDGLDVTRDARVERDGIAYVERLGRGAHQAVLVVRDRAGNASRTAWSFRVV